MPGRSVCANERRLPAVRSHRDVWIWLGGLFLTLFAFLVAVAIAYFVKQANYSLFLNGWMLGVLISFLAAYACFFAAVRSVPFPSLAKPEFPDLTVEIYGISSIDTQREADSGLAVPAHLRSFTARLQNAGTGQGASLTVLLYVRLVPGSWGRVAEAVCPPPDWPLPPSLGLNPMTMPIGLPPGGEVSGQFVYEIPGYYLDKIAEPLSARLELWDRLTDKRMSMPGEIGTHDTSRMVASSGSAEILGPEFAGEPDQQGDARQAPA
jgi:hypothetical protein